MVNIEFYKANTSIAVWHNLCSELTSTWTFKIYYRNINNEPTDE